MTPEQQNGHDAALASVNQARVALRMEPLARMPKGLTCGCLSCPVACALGRDLNADYSVAVGKGVVVFDDAAAADAVAEAWTSTTRRARQEVSLPPALERFRHAFDQGWLPEFNLESRHSAVTT